MMMPAWTRKRGVRTNKKRANSGDRCMWEDKALAVWWAANKDRPYNPLTYVEPVMGGFVDGVVVDRGRISERRLLDAEDNRYIDILEAQ